MVNIHDWSSENPIEVLDSNIIAHGDKTSQSIENAIGQADLSQVRNDLLTAIVWIHISKDPSLVRNIVECALTWHSDWLHEAYQANIKDHWELYMWLSFTWHHKPETIKATIANIEAVIKGLSDKQKIELSKSILRSFEIWEIKMKAGTGATDSHHTWFNNSWKTMREEIR